MKRTVALILTAFIIFSLACSCGKGKGQSQPSGGENAESLSQPATVMVTFAEGKTVMQYGAILEEKGVCSAEEFFRAVNDVDYTGDYGFLPEYSSLADRPYRLEGYLYPDTYEFYLNTNGENVVRKMLSNFSNKVLEVFNNAPDKPLSLDQSVILASIIERESYVESERPKIAQVFFNRLNARGNLAYLNKLQSDATRYYPYTSSDVPKGFESEYNTYEIKGLPKGAICNPSISAISAVFSPDASVTAYYFYTDKNGKHYYADTYEQHQKNVKYCKDNGLAG
ncbi:MAG: endolytic transglycosylase MltG [Clostridia bacterium]|nr:endolytic transglycosylase MltG [Clostridia bacterium]